ncbi:hypothetical protein EDC63_108102 [Sulfurirhabdus autotrophica]|uniref:Uncharacterized protein n=1 Tax=Sulfurirhabdus autotrophica TaxID=1706046 RepID=A0A4R3Y604_9PROT|nr:hypothetical protein EDC63_108102 [Sulfurirhabdus autotrophica]
MDQARINQCIEIACEKGCTEVNAIIEKLETGLPVPEASMLNEAEQEVLLQELKSIMAVYESK